MKILFLIFYGFQEYNGISKKIRYQIDALREYVNPEKPDVPLNKNDAFQKVQKRRVQEKR